MGFGDFSHSHVTYTPSESESDRFGFGTARLTVGFGAADALGGLGGVADAINGVLTDAAAKIVILRYPAGFLALGRSLPSSAWGVHPGGTLVYWESPLAARHIPHPSASEFTLAERISRSSEIQSVLADSFDGYINHYAANPLIDPGIASIGYADWAASTLSDPNNRLFAVADESGLVAVAVVHAATSQWEVELAGVSTRAQGRGHYIRLMSRVQAAAADARADRLLISTQAHNIGVQRAWVKLGLQPISAIDTVHLLRR